MLILCARVGGTYLFNHDNMELLTVLEENMQNPVQKISDVKIKMYLNALKLAFPYENVPIRRLVSQKTENEKVSSEHLAHWLSYIWNLATRTDLSEHGLTTRQVDDIMSARKEIDPEQEYALLLAEKIQVISRQDVEYPTLLQDIHDAPEVLYIQGKNELLTSQKISIVGPRNPSAYGSEIVKKIVKKMVPYQLTVVSGLAMGIDSQAHMAALANNLPTIAVLGAGHASLKLKNHTRLIKDLMTNHLIISEYPFFTEGSRQTFPIRNRIISGLSHGTIVIEARERSGSLITAKLANSQGRGVFAVPGSLYNACSVGTNQLIQKGEATLFTTVEKMCETLNFNTQLALKFEKRLQIVQGAELHKKIYRLLESELHTDQIFDECKKIPAAEILRALTELELKGFITSLPGQVWMRTTLG